MLKENLQEIQRDLQKYTRNKEELIHFYIEQRLERSFEEYTKMLQESYNYVKYKDELKLAKKINRM